MRRGFLSISTVTLVSIFLATGAAGFIGISQYQDLKDQKIKIENRIVEEARALFTTERQLLSEAQDDLSSAQEEIKRLKEQNTTLGKGKKIAADTAGKLTVAARGESDIPTIVKKWYPVVGFVYCNFQTDGVVEKEQMGSGTLLHRGLNQVVLTSKHIIADDEGREVTICVVKFPESDTIYTTGNFLPASSRGADAIYLEIENPDSYLHELGQGKRNYCEAIPELGDKVIILGYPSIGVDGDLTVTDGIISGYEGDYYVTSAKVEYGNSGGAAIDLSHDCYLGIPTYVRSGTLESLARILKWQAF